MVYDIPCKLCSHLRFCLVAVIIGGLQCLVEVSCKCTCQPFLHVISSGVTFMWLFSFIN